MIERLWLKRFKGFQDTCVESFRPVNLVIGGQNVGKTSLLEAVNAMMTNDLSGASALFRGNEGSDMSRYVSSVFSSDDFKISILLEGDRGKVISRSQVDLNKYLPGVSWVSGNFSVYGHTINFARSVGFDDAECTIIPTQSLSSGSMVILYGKLVLGRKKQDLLDLLSAVDSRVLGLDAIAPDGEHRVYAEIDGVDSALQISHLGHGFGRLFHIYSELLISKSNVVLIDEIENGIYYSALPTLFEGVKSVTQRRGVQSIITTHSWECLRAACEVFEDVPEMFQVIRLERVNNNIEPICIDGERLKRMMQNDMEVR
ncbi:ATP/GTP-binding protein [Ideonella sp.]|jgi:AAA15 family ATPase/GTPase|uniref:ATP/GTP-binding protein n=1 Tax=Ideonella sp. TaxID=1929293 RepID=UPI0037BE45B9